MSHPWTTIFRLGWTAPSGSMTRLAASNSCRALPSCRADALCAREWRIRRVQVYGEAAHTRTCPGCCFSPVVPTRHRASSCLAWGGDVRVQQMVLLHSWTEVTPLTAFR